MTTLLYCFASLPEWHTFQTGIRMFIQTVFSLEAIWIFALCNELIASYYRHIETLLEEQEVLSKTNDHQHQLNHILKYLKTIEQANNALYNGFSFTLMSTSILSVSITLVSSYYVIEYFLASSNFQFLVWDVLEIIDFFLRFFCICYSVDQVYSSGIYTFLLNSLFPIKKKILIFEGKTSIPILRRLRDRFHSVSSKSRITQEVYLLFNHLKIPTFNVSLQLLRYRLLFS